MGAPTPTTIMTAITMIIEPPPTAGLGGAALAAVLAWSSPAFPTGAFAYSHGLEAAAAMGWARDEAGLADWIAGVLADGAGWTDAVLLAAAHQATRLGDAPGLSHVAELAAALAPSRERLAESRAQGAAFTAAVRCGWPRASLEDLAPTVCHPVAVGAAAAALEVPLAAILTGYLNGFASNLIAAGIRLGLCGQTGGVRILAGLGPMLLSLADQADRSCLEDLGGCAFRSDIAAMRHETLHTRLFIS